MLIAERTKKWPWGHGLRRGVQERPAAAVGLRADAGNAALSGAASWKCALVGMTPASATVTGDWSLLVDLSKVRHPAYGSEPDGTLSFSGIHFADGSIWGDGDLAYSIEVGGNGFYRARTSFIRYGFAPGGWEDRATGEDFGVVTGVFFGSGHEGIGGVLERHDLSAAIGGKRQARRTAQLAVVQADELGSATRLRLSGCRGRPTRPARGGPRPARPRGAPRR